MADFCQQCSIYTFGEDSGDFAGLVTEEEAQKGFVALVLCEGCGPIQVKRSGECISPDCWRKHGASDQSGDTRDG